MEGGHVLSHKDTAMWLTSAKVFLMNISKLEMTAYETGATQALFAPGRLSSSFRLVEEPLNIHKTKLQLHTPIFPKH